MLYNTMTSIALYHFCAAAIRIGFERRINNFTEPRFEEVEFIYVAKENNVISEQTFRIAFQRTDSVPPDSGFAIAQDGQDYSGIRETFQETFFPFQQRISITFQLLADTVPEPTEAVQLSLSTQDSPAFDSADILSTRTFIVIEDDDSKINLILNFDIVATIIINFYSYYSNWI